MNSSPAPSLSFAPAHLPALTTEADSVEGTTPLQEAWCPAREMTDDEMPGIVRGDRQVVGVRVPEKMGRLLASLAAQENLLLIATRDYRFSPFVQLSIRLRDLLSDQFRAQSARIARVSALIRADGGWKHASWPEPAWRLPAEGAVPLRLADVIDVLAGQHELAVLKLEAGLAVCAELSPAEETSPVLRDLVAQHQKDASMLRALLWEEQAA